MNARWIEQAPAILARLLLSTIVAATFLITPVKSQRLFETVVKEIDTNYVRARGGDVITIPSHSELSVADTRRLQQALKSLGHFSGRVDGKASVETFIAVARWATVHGWVVPDVVKKAHLEFLEKEIGSSGAAGVTASGGSNADNLVARIQTALTTLGYYRGQIDGDLGVGTRSAIAEWAKDRGWDAPKALRPNHAENMEAEIRSRGGATVAVSDVEPAIIKRVQDALSRLGYYSGAIDGKLSGATSAAMEAWAKDRGWAAPTTIRTAHAENMENELRGGIIVESEALKSPLVSEAVAWRADDTSASYIARLRSESRAMAKDCQAEKLTLEALAESLNWQVSDPKGRVKSSLDVAWSGNELSENIPVWLVVSADKPIRFFGEGHIALGPDAPNPMGIAYGRGSTRAMVPLWSKGSAKAEKIAFQPLSAERLQLDVAVVGYLRQCDEQSVLKSDTYSIDVAPAPATIVLDTPTSRMTYTHEIDIPGQGRKLLLNDSSFLLLDRTTNTEILRRGGRDLSMSPTHRFVVVRQGETLELIDVIDGETVAKLHDGNLFWGLGDSVALSTHSPWAKVSLQSTFGDMLRVDNITTGAACCTAESGTTRVGVDLHNGFYTIEGSVGDKVGSLLRGKLATKGVQSGGYAGEGTNPEEDLALITSLGLVAPISRDSIFDAEGGFRPVKTWFDSGIPGAPETETKTLDEVMAMRLGPIGLSARKLDANVASTLFSDDLAQNLIFQFERLGIDLMPMNVGEVMWALDGSELTHSLDMQKRLDLSKSAMERFKREAFDAGWKFDWALPTYDESSLGDCYHVLMEEGSVAEAPLAPRDVAEVMRVSTDRAPIWLARADCTAGATYGSLRSYHAIYFMDLAGPSPRKSDSLLTEGAFIYENNQQQDRWYQHPTRIKANDQFLLTWAPGQGVITVWDRSTQKFVWLAEDLPDGNLLLDAYVTKDARHAVQLNSDASFRIYALSDGRQVLAGRLVEGEIAIWTSNYHYDATAEAAALIDIRFPGKSQTFSLDRFGSARAVAGLAQKVLGTGVFPAEGEELAVPPDLTGTISVDAAGNISAALAFEREKVAAITVFQDGVLTHVYRGTEASDKLTLPRDNSRWVSILATDEDGLASLPVTADLGHVSSDAERRLFVVGVNSYDANKGLTPLSLPLRDAGLVIDTLSQSPGGDAPSFAANGLRDRQATPDTILQGVAQTLDGLARGDEAVFFFAGHGLRDEQGRFYFATSETDANDLANTALHFDKVTQLFAGSEARITVLLDTCHSGLAGQGLFATNDQLAVGLQQLKSNITVVAAAKGRQESVASSESGGGLFTLAFAEIVRKQREKYDIDRNGRIEVRELFLGLQEIVSKESNGAQSPWIVNSRMVGTYALF